MKKKILTYMLVAMVAFTTAGCAGTGSAQNDGGQDASTQEVSAESGGQAEETATYESAAGWSVSYDSSLIACNEAEDGAGFVYIGESAGTNMYMISYVPDKQPEEVLTAATEEHWGDQTDVIRSEDYFRGNKDVWSFSRSMDAPEGGSELRDAYTAFEYNGGVVLIQETLHISDDETLDNPMFEAFDAMLDSMSFKDFAPQSQYSYVPGTYTGENDEGSITLNGDHTGVLSFQDNVDVIWHSTELVAADGSFNYEYTIEGDYLMLNYDGSWLSFVKQ